MKMTKKLAWLLLIWLLLPALAFPTSAAQIIFEAESIPAERQKERLTDGAGLLSSAENEELLGKLDEISVRQACDVVIVTTNRLGGKTPTEFADDFFDYNGFGIGPNADGILLMISMEDRDWAISTHGFGITAFSDAGQAYIMKQILPSLGEGDFFAAFSEFSTLADQFLEQAKNDAPYVEETLPKPEISPKEYAVRLLVSAVLSVLLSLIPLAFLTSSHKSIRSQTHAGTYIRDGSFQVTEGNDLFMYSRESRTRHETSSSSSYRSSSGGTSRTHTSSSGRTHGGSSGKF